MRAMAARLKGTATAIGTAGRGVQSRVRSMTFEGPAGDRFRDRMTASGRGSEAIGASANELANSLLRGAAEAEVALRIWQQQIQQIQEQER